MNLRALTARVKSIFGRAENGWGGPFQGRGELGGWYSLGSTEDGWQRNLTVRSGSGVAALQSAVAAHAHAFALMPVAHKRELDGGGYAIVKTSALSRWLRTPNGFQTAAEFWANGIRCLMEKGNAVACAARNSRNEIVATVWASHHSVHVEPESGEIFYMVSLNDGRATQEQYLIPARDIMHLRINAPINAPLSGRSPIVFCASSLAANAQMLDFINSYMANRASPSYALTTELPLKDEEKKQMLAAWHDKAKQFASGGTAILSHGIKPVQLGVAPGDELLVGTFNMTVEDVARAFSMPRALLGISETAANAEQLMRAWVSLGLGSLVETVEQSINKLFDMAAGEHVEFDHNALLRLDAEAQVRMVGEAVTKGIYSADEARAMLGIGPIKNGYGAMPTIQQQQIPLDLVHALHQADIANKVAPPPEPAKAPEPKPAEPTPEAEKELSPVMAAALWDVILKSESGQ